MAMAGFGPNSALLGVAVARIEHRIEGGRSQAAVTWNPHHAPGAELRLDIVLAINIPAELHRAVLGRPARDISPK